MQVENHGEMKEPLLLFIIWGYQTGGICVILKPTIYNKGDILL